MQSSSLPDFKLCILVYINLTSLFRVLLETTSFAYESEKGTPIFLTGKNILKNSRSACENCKGRKSRVSFSASPSRDELAQRTLQVILEKAGGKHALFLGSWG